MGVQLGRRRIGDRGSLDDKGVCEEAAGNNCGICSRDTNIKLCTGTECMEGSIRFLMWLDQGNGPKHIEKGVE